MNTNNLASLVCIDNLITIKVKFENSRKLYTYKTIDKTIEEGDFVVVYAKLVYEIAYVEHVDSVPDLSKDIDYKWIVQKVDPTQMRELEDKEDKIEIKLREIEQKTVVENAKLLLSEKLGVDSYSLKGLLNEKA